MSPTWRTSVPLTSHGKKPKIWPLAALAGELSSPSMLPSVGEEKKMLTVDISIDFFLNISLIYTVAVTEEGNLYRNIYIFTYICVLFFLNYFYLITFFFKICVPLFQTNF